MMIDRPYLIEHEAREKK